MEIYVGKYLLHLFVVLTCLVQHSAACNSSKQNKKVLVPKQYCNLTVTPVHYDICIDAEFLPTAIELRDSMKNATMAASVKIKIVVDESSCNESDGVVNVITMNPRFLQHIDFVRVSMINLETEKPIQILKQSFRNINGTTCEESQYRIETSDPIKAGEELEIFIPYKILLRRDYFSDHWRGFYFLNADEIHPIDRYYPLSTNYMFPAFDNDPSHKTSFNVSVSRPLSNNIVVLSNMDTVESNGIPGRANWVTDHFRRSLPLQPSQVSVVILHGFRNFTVKHSRLHNHTNVNIWVKESSLGKLAILNKSGDFLVNTMEFFERKFSGWEYPLNKLDFVALPASEASLRHYSTLGIVVNYESGILIEEKAVVPPRAYHVVTMEMAYQWIGAMITIPGNTNPNCLREMLSERVLGLSKYVAKWAIDEIPEFARDWSSYSISSKMREVVLLEALELVFGRDIMESAVLEFFLPKMMWRTAHGKEFYESLQQAIDKHSATHLLPPVITTSKNDSTFLEIFQSMLNYTYYNPMIHVKSDENSTNSIELSQQNMIDPDYQGDVYTGVWWIPVKILSESGNDMIWLPPTTTAEQHATSIPTKWSSSVIDSEKWLIINPDGIPYCNLKYDANLLRNIVTQLNKNHTVIPAKARHFLVENQFDLLNHYGDWGFVDGSVMQNAFEMTTYLHNEMNWMVWSAVLKHIDDLRGHFNHFGVQEAVQVYFSARMEPMLDKIGMHSNDGEDEGITLLMSVLLENCAKLQVPKCVQYSRDLMREWMERPEIDTFSSPNISPGTRKQMYCAAIRKSWTADDDITHSQVFNFLLARVMNLNSETYHDVDVRGYEMLDALTCTKSERLLAGLLNHTVVDMIPDYLKHYYVKQMPMKSRQEILVKLDVAAVDFWMAQVLKGRMSPQQFVNDIWYIIWRPFILEGIPEKITKFLDGNKELFSEEFLALSVENIKLEMATNGKKIVNLDFRKEVKVDERMLSWLYENSVVTN